MKLIQRIIERSKQIDKDIASVSDERLNLIDIIFKVPSFHPRANEIDEYFLKFLRIEDLLNSKVYNLSSNKLFIIDESASKYAFVQNFIKKNKILPIILKAIESKSKTKPFLDELFEKYKLGNAKNLTIIVIGGGLLLNIGAYLAERTTGNLILLPTTVLSMADGSGGKVRVNFISEDRAYKHFYKSFYEPDAIFIDDRFLESLPEKQIKIGLVEIIKHGLFQSPALYDFLINSGKKLLKDSPELRRAIIWAATLKKVCLEVDVEENENGSRRILRGGHDFSDRIEEDSKLQIPHGIAVAIGIIKQLQIEKDNKRLERAIKIFKTLDIPYTLEDFKKT